MVSDLGASFGTTGESWSHERSKGNLQQYRKSKFISKTTPEYVSFGTPVAAGADFRVSTRMSSSVASIWSGSVTGFRARM